MTVANLCSRRKRHLRIQTRCRSRRTARRRYLRITSSQWRWHPANSCFPSSYPFFFLFPFQALRPAFFLHVYPFRRWHFPHSSLLHQSSFPFRVFPGPEALGLFPRAPRARVRLNRLLLHPFLARHTRPLGRIPFPFLPFPLPSFFIRLLSLRLFPFLPPPSPPIPCVTSLSSSSPSSSRTMFCAMSFLS